MSKLKYTLKMNGDDTDLVRDALTYYAGHATRPSQPLFADICNLRDAITKQVVNHNMPKPRKRKPVPLFTDAMEARIKMIVSDALKEHKGQK